MIVYAVNMTKNRLNNAQNPRRTRNRSLDLSKQDVHYRFQLQIFI